MVGGSTAGALLDCACACATVSNTRLWGMCGCCVAAAPKGVGPTILCINGCKTPSLPSHLPADLPSIVTVASSEQNDSLSEFSNYGK